MIFKKRKELTGHSAGIYSLAFDGNFLYSASADHFVARWNIELGVQDKFSIRFETSVYALHLIRDNKFLVVGLSNGDLHIFDLVEKKEIKYFTQHRKAVFALADNAVKGHFYAADADGNLSVWNDDSFELLLYIPIDCGKIRRIAVSSNGDFMALACQDGTIRVFDTTHFNEVSTFKAHKDGCTAVIFHPLVESELISGGKDALLKLWNWKEGRMIKEVPAHNYVIYDILAINEGQNFVTASRDKTIKVWNTEQFTFLQRIDLRAGGHRHSVNTLLGLNSGSFVSGSDDKKVIIFEQDRTV
jgi:WD40 repeat protein